MITITDTASGKKIGGQATGKLVRGPTENEDFTVSATPRDRTVTPGTGPTPVVVKDANFNQYTSSVVDKEFDITIQLPTTAMSATITNLAPSIATNVGTVVTRVTDGTARFSIAVPGLGTRILEYPVSRVASATTNTFVSWRAGSFAKAVTDFIDGLIASKTADASTLNIWNPYNNTTESYAQNTSCFGAAGDMTAFCPKTSRGGSAADHNIVNPTLFVQDTATGVAHLAEFVGGIMVFVDEDNNVFHRTVTNRGNLLINGYSNPDVNLCLLDSPLPSQFKPVKILPANYLNYLPNLDVPYGTEDLCRMPVLNTDQYKTLQVSDLCGFVTTPAGQHYAFTRKPLDAKRIEFYRLAISGDSGSPCWIPMPTGNDKALLFCYTFTNAGVIHYGNFKTEINAGLLSLGSAYQVQEVDLTPYTFYA